jgi:hypothetical protein
LPTPEAVFSSFGMTEVELNWGAYGVGFWAAGVGAEL